MNREEILLTGKTLTVADRLLSRRNEVLLVHDSNGEEYVLKRYKQDSISTEKALLTHLRAENVPVPEIVASESDALLMSYISGDNLCDLLEDCERRNDMRSWKIACDALSGWLAAFYGAFDQPVLRGDVNLRNFIFDGSWVYGVDFESREAGAREEDIALILCYVLSYDPPFTAFKSSAASTLFAALTDRLHPDRAILHTLFEKNLRLLCMRRGLDIPPDAGKILMKE